MAEASLKLLLDQNIPLATADWLRSQESKWLIQQVKELGFAGRSDEFLYQWAQREGAIVITYDEDFADARYYPLGQHHGIIRLRVWPKTTEKTIETVQLLGYCVTICEHHDMPSRLRSCEFDTRRLAP